MSSLIPVKNYINTVNIQENESVSDKKHTNTVSTHTKSEQDYMRAHTGVCVCVEWQDGEK